VLLGARRGKLPAGTDDIACIVVFLGGDRARIARAAAEPLTPRSAGKASPRRGSLAPPPEGVPTKQKTRRGSLTTSGGAGLVRPPVAAA